MFLTDSHCHLDMLDLTADQGDLNKVIDRALQNDVRYLLNVSVTLADFPTVLKTAEAYPFVSASVGLHPNEQSEETNVEQLVSLARSDKVVAIGETGLDYYRSTGDIEWQRDRFRAHIEAARQVKKPLIIHARDAKEDILAIMKEENLKDVGGVLHCFTEDWDMAKRAIDMNFYVSISGIVTFKNAATIQDVAKQLPLDRLLIETDSPYLAPNPYRGKQNEPSMVRYTAEFIANLRGQTLDEIARATTDNFFQLFSGAVRPHV